MRKAYYRQTDERLENTTAEIEIRISMSILYGLFHCILGVADHSKYRPDLDPCVFGLVVNMGTS